MKFSSTFAPLLALAALAAAAGAQGAERKLPDLSGEEVAALAVYAVPGLIAATSVTCSGRLAQDGFLARRGASLTQRYAAHREKAWPLARQAMFKFAGSREGDQLKMFASLPDEAVRPLVDALIEQEAAARIRPASCRNVERMAEALSPLEPPQAGRILGVLFDIAAAGDQLIARAGQPTAKP